MTRNVKTTDEASKHGTRTAEGQKRRADRRAAAAEALGVVEPGASRREVDAALRDTRIEFLRSEAKTWEQVEPDMLHVADIEGWPGQLSFSPHGVITFQIPLAYIHRLAELMQYGGGVVFMRLYRLRPEEMADAAELAFQQLEALARELDPWVTNGDDEG